MDAHTRRDRERGTGDASARRTRPGLRSLALLMVLALGACAQAGAPTPHRLTDTQQDAEYLVAWETVGQRCPETVGQPLLQGFVLRGEAVELAAGERMTLAADSPSLWGSTRLLREGDPNGGDFRSLSVEISLLESDDALQDMVAQAEQIGVTITGEPVASGIAEPSFPGGSMLVGAAAAHRLMVSIRSLSAGDTTGYCDHAGMQALVDDVAERLATVEPGES